MEILFLLCVFVLSFEMRKCWLCRLKMAYKCREEIVGKRFLSVSGFAKLKLSKISEWGWRAGVIRAATHKDSTNKELQVCLYFALTWKGGVFHCRCITLRHEHILNTIFHSLYYKYLNLNQLEQVFFQNVHLCITKSAFSECFCYRFFYMFWSRWTLASNKNFLFIGSVYYIWLSYYVGMNIKGICYYF